MEKKSLGRSFLILSVAGILIKILSALYMPFLLAILGTEGYGIYQASYTILVFILAVTSLGAQPAVTKVVAELRATGHHKDALRAFKLARRYLALIGGIITIIFIVFAEPISAAYGWPEAVKAIRFLAPTVFFSCILATYRGYFQGIEDMETIGISQIIEQIVNVVLSLIFAIILNAISIEFGAAGGTVGTSIGAVVAIVFIIFIFNKNDYEEEAISNNVSEKRISDKKIIKRLLVSVIPITMVAVVQNASSLVDATVVKRRLVEACAYTSGGANSLYGLLASYNTLLYVPLAIVTALSTAIFPKIIAAFSERNKRNLKFQISYAYRITFMITIPATVGLSILSKEVYTLLFGGIEGYKFMMYGSIVLIFMSLTTIQNTILQGVNKLYLVLSTAFIGLVIKFIIDFTLVGIKEINIYGAVIASFCAYLGPAVINHMNLNKLFKIKIPIFKQTIAPILSSIMMAIAIYIVRIPVARLINILDGGRLMVGAETLLLVAIGGLTYFMSMILLGGIRKKDIELISPKLFRVMPKFIRKML